ncbi:MAG TPA: O-antigen ligase family protein, partial [Ktedonobacterales bacterium]
NAFLILSGLAAVLVCIEFKRIGADVYMFRYTEPRIFYMQLGALAQYMGLGAMIAYARALCAPGWRVRLGYLALTALCVLAVYFTLQNSRWVYTAVGLIVITFVFSRRLFATLCVLSLPLIPVAISVFNHIQAVKGTRDLNRFTVWQDMLRVWEKRPVLGVGPGNAWSYDQVFTNLPVYLRNLASDGLGVAHNGVLQVLVEVGPLGVFCYYAFAIIVAIMAVRLYRRSRSPEKRADRILALICLGLICGSVAADPVSGIFFLPPSQIGGWNDLPRVMSTWIMFGCLIYKDQLWRTARRMAHVIHRRGVVVTPAPDGAMALQPR